MTPIEVDSADVTHAAQVLATAGEHADTAVTGDPAAAARPATAGPAGEPLAPTGPVTSGRYSLLLTREPEHVHAAQRLRHQVFVGEQGARIAPSVAAREGRDADSFDEHCDHLVVREDATGAIVGTYRMLTPDGARAAGGLYSDTEFDLSAIDALRPKLVEVGRSCVHPDHRNGVVLSLVWAGIHRYLLLTGHRYVVGCASVPLTPQGALPGSVWSRVSPRHLAPPSRQVRPRRPARVGPDRGGPAARTEIPPLLRGYLRLGAEIGGRPALDPDFGVADLFVLLDHTAIDPRWRRHLLGER